MAERVLIKVVGFTDVERHALNTVFRLSQDREVSYDLWLPDAGREPCLVLLDGEAYESPLEAASPPKGVKLAWVGDRPPAGVWRSFSRPLVWPEVVGAFDELFLPPAPLDFDLDEDLAGPSTQPGETPPRRALIASADRDLRLYLRAKLALSHMTLADEAENAAQAMDFARSGDYAVALLDFDLPGAAGWEAVQSLGGARDEALPVIVMKREPAASERWRARSRGAHALLGQPPDPVKLGELLQKL